MPESAVSQRFIREYSVEPESIVAARRAALEWNVRPVSPELGAHLASVTALTRADAIAEVGTGVGVSGLWLLAGAAKATLTTIEIEVDYHQAARKAFRDAGIPSAQTRAILGRGRDVLERLADDAYDVVFLDADLGSAAEYVAHGLRIARPGGAILLARALDGGRVADPVVRDAVDQDLRDLLSEIGSREAVRSSLLGLDGGLLTIVKPGA